MPLSRQTSRMVWPSTRRPGCGRRPRSEGRRRLRSLRRLRREQALGGLVRRPGSGCCWVISGGVSAHGRHGTGHRGWVGRRRPGMRRARCGPRTRREVSHPAAARGLAASPSRSHRADVAHVGGEVAQEGGVAGAHVSGADGAADLGQAARADAAGDGLAAGVVVAGSASAAWPRPRCRRSRRATSSEPEPPRAPASRSAS